MPVKEQGDPERTEQGDPERTEQSDPDLIRRCARRDEHALEALHGRYSRAAYGLALSVLRHPSDAEEVVQDCFLKIWNQPGVFDPARASFAAFFMTMVRNRALDQIRKRRPTSALEDEEGQAIPLPDSREGPPERAELEQLGGRLAGALEQLSENHRQTVLSAVYRGLSRHEIAQEMGVPVGTVKSRLKYALDRLRVELKGGDW